MTYNINTNLSSPVFTVTDNSIFDFSKISNTSWNNNLSGTTLEVKGDANFEGDIKVKGKSITDSLERIEERLAVLRPNEALEEKWEKLRSLRKAYMELEQEIIEKEGIWATLKK